MKSGLMIEWTFHAQAELNAIYDYLERNWTEREIKRFSKRLDENLAVIAKFPFVFPTSEKNKSVRRCVVSKQTSLYYLVEAKKIIILSLFDNRQNPDKLKI